MAADTYITRRGARVRKGRAANNRVRTLAACIAIALVLLGIFVAGAFITTDAAGPDFANKSLAPSLNHPFGTDWLGRDMLLRTLKGLSLSIRLGAVASVLSACIATLVGVAAAAGPRGLDGVLNWLIDLMMGIPHLVLLILISFACGRGMTGLLVGISLTHWASLARLVRAEVLQLRGQQYVLLSRRLGHGPGWMLRRHFLPAILPQVAVGLVLLFPHAILHESALSFLGYGLPPEQPAVGIILSESMGYLSAGLWWLAVFPGAMLVLVVLLFDQLGQGLKRLADPASAQE